MIEKNFDDWVNEIQQDIIEKEKQTFSKKVIEEFQNPKNLCKLENADLHGKIQGVCGDTMQIFLKIDEDKIKKATFYSDGCGATIACGSMITQMIEGKRVDEVYEITPEDLVNALDGLPEENLHCATLVVSTVFIALQNYKDDIPLN